MSVTRRSFLKWSAVLGTAATLGCGSSSSSDDKNDGPSAPSFDKEVWNGCNVNCGSHCPLKLHVKDGVVVRVSTDNENPDEYGDYGAGFQFRACVRGRSIRQRLYNPDRVKYPMKRVAGSVRGEGKYERISWEQAINEISAKMLQVKSNYGPGSFYIQYATGTIDASFAKSWTPAASPLARLHNLWGGWLNHYGNYSTPQIGPYLPMLLGGSSQNTITDAVNSNLVVLWGNNPANTRMGSGAHYTYHLQKAKEKNPNLKFISIDPHYNDTAIALEADWISIRPGTDTALVAGMAYYLLDEGLLDEAWINAHCVGWSEASMAGIVEATGTADGAPEGTEPAVPANSSYKSYLLGLGADATLKTPEWASEITGIPVAIIKSFAKRLINEKPAMIIQGWGPQRHYLGGNNCRAISLMAILTKNIGIQGGGSGARESGASVSLSFRAWSTTFPSNPVTYTVSHYTWYQAILDHTSMTRRTWGVKGLATADTPLPLPIKFIWNYAGNCMTNQHGDINETMKMYKDESKCECIVTIENSFTPSALVSDYILPDCTNWEQNDVTTNSGGNSAIMVFDTKAVEPLFECKTIYEMLTLIADKIGIKEQFTEGRTQDEWLEFLFNEMLRINGDQGVFTAENGLDTYAKAKAAGLVRKVVPTATPSVAYKAFVDDPVTNKVSTPSGKFEIFSKRLYNLSHQWVLPGDGLDRICAIPEFHATQDGYTHSKRDEYPFQVVGHHYKQRTHSTYYNTSWNREANPQTAWINSGDAANLGIRHGDTVEIWNDRGKVRVKAKVTPRIMPGVIALPQGAWYNPGGKWFNSKIEHTGSITAAEVGNTSVVDHGGCNNVLTSLRPEAYSKGNCQHSVLANVRKVG